ncbi:MAG: hypothetical protein O7H41_14995 [Planctomycetota bacterium]|nr:hypothetical protein [Planctomycetota bacterium]
MAVDSKAKAVMERHTEKIMKIPGVQGMAVGSGSDYGGMNAPCVVIYVNSKCNAGDLPKELDGVQVHVLMS